MRHGKLGGHRGVPDHSSAAPIGGRSIINVSAGVICHAYDWVVAVHLGVVAVGRAGGNAVQARSGQEIRAVGICGYACNSGSPAVSGGNDGLGWYT